VILGVHSQNESEDDAVSFLTGHVIHPVSGVRLFRHRPSRQR
jgi:hypothetical protein